MAEIVYPHQLVTTPIEAVLPAALSMDPIPWGMVDRALTYRAFFFLLRGDGAPAALRKTLREALLQAQARDLDPRLRHRWELLAFLVAEAGGHERQRHEAVLPWVLDMAPVFAAVDKYTPRWRDGEPPDGLVWREGEEFPVTVRRESGEAAGVYWLRAGEDREEPWDDDARWCPAHRPHN